MVYLFIKRKSIICNLFILIISLIILFSGFICENVFATEMENNLENLTQEQIRTLIQIRYNLDTIDDLQKRDVLTIELAEVQTKYYLAKADSIIGGQLEIELNKTYLITLLDNHNLQNNIIIPQSDTTETTQQRKGFFTFINIIWFLSSILLVIALAWLTKLYLYPILKEIPASVYEMLIYVICFAFIIGGHWFKEGISQFIALPGCIGLIGGLVFTHYLHEKDIQKFYNSKTEKFFSFNSFILFVIWGGVALFYQSSFIAFMSILALESFLGFSVMVMPLCYCIGFKEKSSIPRAMMASFFLLFFCTISKIVGLNLSYFNVFSKGMLFIGTFVYFIGLLIISTKWYSHKNKEHYIYLQLLTIISGVLAFFIGSVWQISQIQGIGGTFFILYLIEKYFELPWGKKTWAWRMLGLSIILYLLSFLIRQYPEYFLFSG